MLGHSSVQLTLDTYSHLLPDMGLKERAAARLDAPLTPKKKDENVESGNPGQTPAKVVKKW